jgi:preprotein translocase subunit SecB
MADTPTANGAAGAEATLTIQKLYIKDASFEVPNAPQIFQEQAQPQVQLNLSQKVSNFAENLYEVALTVTVTCKVGDKTAYLAEVQQAGVFGLVGFPQQDLQTVLATYCPHTLYPYARQAISNMILDGGFPPFNLQPINFEQLYAQQMNRAAASQGAVANA